MRSGSAASLAASLAVIVLLMGSGTLALSGHTAEAILPTAGATQQFSLQIIPLVDYLLLPAGLRCDYGQGSASLVVSQLAANLTVSVQGDVPNRAYSVVMITNEGNFSIGTMTIAASGNGTFSGGAKLAVTSTARLSALYQVAVRLYYLGQVPTGCFSLDLVGIPFPVIISGYASTTTSTSSTAAAAKSSSSSSSTSTSSQSVCAICSTTKTTTTKTTTSKTTAQTTSQTTSVATTVTKTTSKTSQTTSSTQKPTTSSSTTVSILSTASTFSAASTTTVTAIGNTSASLEFKLVSLPDWLRLPEPLNYPFLSGTATVDVAGNTLHVESTILGTANTRFIIQLHANDLNITLGTVTTSAGGTASLAADTDLDNGTYLIGIRVYQAAQVTAMMTLSSLVGVSVPLADPVVIGSGSAVTTSTSSTPTSSTTTHVTTSTQTPAASTSLSENNFSYFDLNLVRLTSMPVGYMQGSGTVDMDLLAGVLDVSVQLDHANPDTTYQVVMQLGKTNVTLGTFITNSTGSAQLDAEVPVGTGTYTTFVLVYDESSFRSPTLVMSGATSTVSIVAVSTSSATLQTQSQKPSVISVSPNAISTAEANGTIPAEIQISSSGQELDVINHNFSVSVARVSDTGVAITVSGQNVTGPRTFLVDVNGSLAKSITSGSFEILFDGQQIFEASSLSAVLSPQAGAPPAYAIVQTSSGVQLLVSVPHFSTHVIEILGVSFQSIKSILEVSLPVLLAAMVVVTLIFGTIYASRRRV